MFRVRLRHAALTCLAVFVTMIVVTGVAPWMEAHAFERVCSVRGDHWVDADGHVVDTSGDDSGHDHSAHCPLCVPVGAPPTPFAWVAHPDRPVATLATRRYAAHLAALVGAPFPPRAPPYHS